MNPRSFVAVTAALALAGTAGAQSIRGVVTNGKTLEAGVWVIAETEDLPTKYAKIVVTDERGRFLIPELPKASYRVWVRGYGLVDSKKVKAKPGDLLRLKAIVAPNEGSAAQYYPAIYWYAMVKVPARSEFPLGKAVNQMQWLDALKSNGCIGCHALGNAATRTVPHALGHFTSSQEAWARRITSGQAMTQMTNVLGRADPERMLREFANWTDRVAAGEIPRARPLRPQGVERNVVVTLWDWSNARAYLHDEVSTDKRNPTVNAYGRIYGTTEESTDMLPVLDPAKHVAAEFEHPVRDPETPSSKDDPMAPSPHWGAKPLWDSHTTTHNPMLDERGRIWYTARVRPPRNPEFCRKGSSHPSAQVLPLESANRQLSMLDPRTGKFTLISTCFSTHHLAFAEDANHTLWTSAGGAANPALGWLNRRLFDETGDEEGAQGWTPFVLDTNGNGKRDAYVEPGEAADPAKDTRVVTGLYAVAVNPVDGTIWGTSRRFPGYVVRVDPGADPANTALTELFEPPLPGYGPRGGDIDRHGVYWSSLASGHLASFDRRKCKGPLNGPQATGAHCPEGWTLYPFPGPQFQNLSEPGSAESSYYTWVDQFDTFGLGKNVPIATGNLNEGLLALADGKFVLLRVPYPLGYYTKWLDGRIDDAAKGWKGRGLWSTVATRAPFHMEGGKGTRPKVVRFQLRPSPTAD
ncbi:MAG: hypothetical protein ABR570_12360 [Burkholderiales bacterium]